jgi:hypothetical protein
MIESVILGGRVLRFVVVIGDKLLGCADNRKIDPHPGKARLEAVNKKGVGDVFVVPGQEKIHAMNSRCRQMRGIADRGGGQDAAANQSGGESLDLLVEVEKLNTRKQFEVFGGLGGFAFARFVEDELSSEEIEFVSLEIPPLAGEFLPRELQEIPGRAGDVVAGNGSLNEN